MNQKIVEGLAKILEDEKLKKEFMEAKTPQEAYEIAKSYLDGASFEEFQDTVKSITSSKETLSLDDLDDVSGGSAGSIVKKVGGVLKNVDWEKTGKYVDEGVTWVKKLFGK